MRLSVVAIVTGLAVTSAYYYSSAIANIARSKISRYTQHLEDIAPSIDRNRVDLYPVADYVKGPPTVSIFDNLREDVSYITTFNDAGFTNQLITILNLIHLADITNRVAIIPPFFPYHITSHHVLPLSQIFDMTRFKNYMGQPVIEWKDVKDPSSKELDVLGCWSAWATAHMGDEDKIIDPRDSNLLPYLNADASYTPAPKNIRTSHGGYAKFWPLARLSYPSGRKAALEEHGTLPSKLLQTTLEPSDHLQCFDYLYFVAADEPYEFEHDYGPAWNLVGKHLHFNSEVKALSEKYLRQIFQVSEDENVPPFVGIHIRHGDFRDRCRWKHLSDEDCFAPMSTYREAVDELRNQLLNEQGLDVSRVLVFSDEHNPAWWKTVEDEGWYRVNHHQLQIVQDLGAWYPIVLDQAMLSMAAAMIGTYQSTFSEISMKRIQDWNNGPTKILKFYVPAAE